METVTRDDLKPLMSAHRGNETFRQALQQVAHGDALLSLLGRYVQFNATFGGCVANLAGEIAVRQDLFRDAADPIPIFADRSIEVASDVIAAAIDEFDDRATAHRDTHRTLAQATIRAAGEFFGKDAAALNALLQPDSATLSAVSKVHAGYGVNRALQDADILRALGFHAASELLADEEFRFLDQCMRAQFPDLVASLEAAKVLINGDEHAAYYWIHIHTSVEADHFAFALQGANRALAFYAGSAADAKRWVLEGFAQFADLQTAFMESLLSV
jgi:hypothetical protein